MVELVGGGSDINGATPSSFFSTASIFCKFARKCDCEKSCEESRLESLRLVSTSCQLEIEISASKYLQQKNFEDFCSCSGWI